LHDAIDRQLDTSGQRRADTLDVEVDGQPGLADLLEQALGLKGDIGIGSRAERVVVITGGLVFAPWGGLQWAIYVLAATAWLTVVQRVLYVRRQLREQGQA